MSEAMYKFRPAGEGLADRIDGVWHLSRDGDDTPRMIAPDGACEIILHRSEPPLERDGDGWTRQPAAFLYGPLNRVLVLRQSGPMDVVGIRLHPWAVGALGARPSAWRNRAVPLAEILGVEPSRHLLEFARTASSPVGFLDLAGNELDCVLQPPLVQTCVRRLVEALQGGEVTGLAGLAAMAGTSERTVGRRFERACGLTAGNMIRIFRFHRARNAIKAGLALTEVAADAGYADQAHMTRDFRRFAGITPVPARNPAPFDVFYPGELKDAETHSKM
ncbi:helix-turn-helix domain-containing protein [Maricaulis maris]|uniref:Helix-turn-helix protein n=1 Tax=Maricaulis maris TaxID=74318 RepID=A0A495D3W2_9PROT|nr:helix-turn-helix domain-containing protein [Maricaulis maris]RKQ96597.1 helix-turn-helix protein [Maricaulis maris]